MAGGWGPLGSVQSLHSLKEDWRTQFTFSSITAESSSFWSNRAGQSQFGKKSVHKGMEPLLLAPRGTAAPSRALTPACSHCLGLRALWAPLRAWVGKAYTLVALEGLKVWLWSDT